MDISDYITIGSFLKAEEIKNTKDGAIVIGEGERVTNKFNDERLHIPVEFMGKQKIFDCSKTNAKTIAEALGKNTKDWVGGILYLETYKVKTSDGQLVDAINVQEAKKLPVGVNPHFNKTETVGG